MHPSEAIRGRRSHLLEGRRIVVGVSGSIAAVEVPRILRELLRHGASLECVMSPDALRLITAEAVRFALGHPPVTEITGDVEHVRFLGPGPEQADLLLLAPATANTLGKIAHGIDDTPVTTCASVALGNGVPVLVAPAMHEDMSRNPFVVENLERLRSRGVGIIPPVLEEGESKLAGPEAIAAHVLHRLGRGPWGGRKVLIVGGAAAEAVDEVRYLTNASSGRLATELAAQAYYRGAEVIPWLGETRQEWPRYLPSPTPFRSVGDLEGILDRQPPVGLSAVFVPAALSDYALEPVPGKIRSEENPRLTLTLTRREKFLPRLRRSFPAPVLLIGFKLESESSPEALVRRAREFLQRNSLDAVVANGPRGMGGEETEVYLVRARGKPHRYTGRKAEVAGKVLDDLAGDVTVPVSEGSSPRPPRSR
jgi:phosphopantothenoylcysteine decarboxylase/phosphopantothenate--cysteine ligase